MDDCFNKGLNVTNKKNRNFHTKYLCFKNILERISEVLGIDLKILFVLRQPAKRVYSHYLMSKRRGFEDLDIKEAIKQE